MENLQDKAEMLANKYWFTSTPSKQLLKDLFVEMAEWEIRKCGKDMLKIQKNALWDAALNYMDYLNGNRPIGKMCLSNGECKDIKKAFQSHDWEKLHQYYDKYIKQ